MNEHLDRLVRETVSSIKGWHEVVFLKLPPVPNNPYVRIKAGKILSNGLHEKADTIFTVYYDGTILRSNTL